MKKEIEVEARKEICKKISEAYNGYNDIIAKIADNAVLYVSNENGVVWVWDSVTFTEFLNMGVIDTSYYVYRFRLVNGILVTVKA